MITVELEAAIDDVGTVRYFYFADENFVTKPTDQPANTIFDPALKDPGSIGLNVFSSNALGGGSSLELGEMRIVNNGVYDELLNYGFDGRSVVIRFGPSNGSYPADFLTLFTGTIDGVAEGDFEEIIFRLRDLQYVFNQPSQENLYLGDNELPDGFEGTTSDLKGKRKPLLFGLANNITPFLVNTARLIYQVNDGPVQSIVNVYTSGVALIAGVDVADKAALEAYTVTAGTYVTCLAEGLFKLHTGGNITCDAAEGADASQRTCAQILARLAARAKLTVDQIDAASVVNLDLQNSAEIGIYITDGTFADAMDLVAQSIQAYYIFKPEGILTFGLLSDPVGIPALELFEYDIGDDIQIIPNADALVPVYSYTVNYSKNWTVQTSDIAGVAEGRKAYLKEEYRSAPYKLENVRFKHKLARTVSANSLLMSEPAAIAEAQRRQTLYGKLRQTFEVPLPVRLASAASLELMSVVKLQINRFGLNNGKLFRLIGLRLDLQDNRVFLKIWG